VANFKTSPAFAWRYWGKPPKPVSEQPLPCQFQTGHLPNRRQKSYLELIEWFLCTHYPQITQTYVWYIHGSDYVELKSRNYSPRIGGYGLNLVFCRGSRQYSDWRWVIAIRNTLFWNCFDVGVRKFSWKTYQSRNGSRTQTGLKCPQG
jgi:hypothetical protein